mgnify:CR=1 FL=1
MKIHNASNENASVTLKPDEMAEVTTVGFNSMRIIQTLLDEIVELHDNGEWCPMCGTYFTNTDAYNGVDEFCSNSDCIFNRAQKFLNDAPQTLHTFKLVCSDLGVESSIDLE